MIDNLSCLYYRYILCKYVYMYAYYRKRESRTCGLIAELTLNFKVFILELLICL